MKPKHIPTLKKSDLRKDTIYLLCPDSHCNLYWVSDENLPCEHNCPLEDKLIKIIVCNNCQELIELPGNHNYFDRVDHKCSDTNICSNHQRMSGKYHLMYEKPK